VKIKTEKVNNKKLLVSRVCQVFSSFQVCAAAMGEAHLPTEDSCVAGTATFIEEAEHNLSRSEIRHVREFV